MINRVDIHNHTQTSNLRLRDALMTVEELIDKAIELKLRGIAVTDHEILSSHPRANKYYQKIKNDNPDFKVILGNEIYLVDERHGDKHFHFILLAKDSIGHYQLRRLSSLAWLNAYASKGLTRVDTLKEDLESVVKSNPGHLIASTACIGGELGYNILKLNKAEKMQDAQTSKEAHDRIVNFILWCKELFGEDFYLEVQPGVSPEQIIVNRRMMSISKCFDVKMIPTSDSHMLSADDRYIHKAFLNSEEKEREVDAFYQDAYLHSSEEMIEKFKMADYDELFTRQMFENTMEIYDKIEDYSLLHPQQVPSVQVDNYPKRDGDLSSKYKTLNEMYSSDDKIERYWINKCVNALKDKDKFNDIYLSELEEEAEVKRIVGNKLGTNMFSYPIALAHYIDLIWKCGSPVGVGRGSACAALNHYLLGITQLDPIEWNFPFFRYMNRDTEGLGDIDIDVAPSIVPMIIDGIRTERGKAFNPKLELTQIEKNKLGATYVCTFGTESSKSAVLTSCRGYRSEEYPDGIDVDTSKYLSSLIPSERGFTWSLSDVFYGDEDKDRKPVRPFIKEVSNYPGLKEIMFGIEGCISRRGRHASGVLFMDEDPYAFNAFMRTPSGEIVTQYDLHDAEDCGSTKMDILVTEVQDKIKETVRLLQENNEIESWMSLKEAYDKYLHPDILPLDDLNIWKIIQKAEVLDMFQLDSEIGRQGAKKIKPTTMHELSNTNGLIRLMTAEKGQETWIDKYVRYKNDINEYYSDIEKYELSDVEKEAFNRYLKLSIGIGISQEQLMKTLMDDDICGFSLKDANKARKIISKKKMSDIPNLRHKIYDSATNRNVADYIWDYVVSPQLGYAFSDIHSLSYSFIGFQTAYIATRWNSIYWNTACLIVNSGSLETEDESKDKSSDYSKIAKAIGNITSKGIQVSLIDINNSSYGFAPDTKNNEILFGLKGVNKIGSEVVETIIKNRPYESLDDFLNKCNLNKTAMISLIKGGAFDKTEKWAYQMNSNVHPRVYILAYYISQICEKKNKLTLSNFNGLMQKELVPDELCFEKRVFVFNKDLKAKMKYGEYYLFNDNHTAFYSTFFDLDNLVLIDGRTAILQKTWDSIYKNVMNTAREWLKENEASILQKFNSILFKESWDKYAEGNTSAWEMESLCFYHGKHELSDINKSKYGIDNFFEMSEKPPVESYLKRGGRDIPIYEITSIAGTVLGKNDTRSSISLLTTDGVVNVKFTREHYAMYNRQISEVQSDGSKKIMEKGWFGRGNLLVVSGYRLEDNFIVKTYKRSGRETIYKITDVKSNGDIVLTHDRYNGGE